MKIVSSYKVKIVGCNTILNDTLSIYREAVTYLIKVVNTEWFNFCELESKERNNYLEKCIHTTKNNKASYDFDDKFYKFPSYLRRAALQDAIGIVSSYRSNLENYETERYQAISNGKKFRAVAPKLQTKHYKCLALYRGNMFNMIDQEHAQIKIYRNNDWVWHTVKLREQDLKYIKKYCFGKEFSPLLAKKGRTYYLQFAYEEDIKLSKTKLKDQKVLAVDLGVNYSAVCSVINYNGTVLGRKFINQPREKDRQCHLLNRLRKKQRMSAKSTQHKALWAKINNLNTQIVNDTVRQVIKFALEHEVDVIVMEYLSFSGKKKRTSKLQQLQMWAYRLTQQKLSHQAHKHGMKYARVCAKNTSLLAFDGTGLVSRSTTNATQCTFKRGKGKRYNCDLNASYNIGARYFISQIHKTISAKKWSQAQAKVPELVQRTKCTLSTLISLVAVI